MNKKILLCLGLVFATLIVFKIGKRENANASKCGDKAEYDMIDGEEMYEYQKNALCANEKLYSSFEWDDTYVYPDEFGGAYLEFDVLHVLLTDKSAINKYKDLLHEYDCVKYDIVEYSYNELNRLAEDTFEKLKNKYNITSYYVDMENNNVVISITDEKFEDDDECDGLVHFVIETPVTEESTIISGSSIINASGSGFTLAANGIYNGNQAYLTCGHSMSTEMPIYYSSSIIGYIAMKRYSGTQNGDFSIIRKTNYSYDLTSEYYRSGYNVYNFTMTYGNPPLNSYGYKYGKNGGQAYYKITGLNITVTSNGVAKCKGMTKAKLINGVTLDGDSGGFYRSGNALVGVHHGSNTSDGYTYVFFTPYVYPNEAGFIATIN